MKRNFIQKKINCINKQCRKKCKPTNPCDDCMKYAKIKWGAYFKNYNKTLLPKIARSIKKNKNDSIIFSCMQYESDIIVIND